MNKLKIGIDRNDHQVHIVSNIVHRNITYIVIVECFHLIIGGFIKKLNYTVAGQPGDVIRCNFDHFAGFIRR